ncbi:hypothetical protein FKM82_029351 [Ascaphus truei]
MFAEHLFCSVFGQGDLRMRWEGAGGCSAPDCVKHVGSSPGIHWCSCFHVSHCAARAAVYTYSYRKGFSPLRKVYNTWNKCTAVSVPRWGQSSGGPAACAPASGSGRAAA